MYAQDDCRDSIRVARAAWQFNRLWGEESTGRPNNIGWMVVLTARVPLVNPEPRVPTTSASCCSQSNAIPLQPNGVNGWRSLQKDLYCVCADHMMESLPATDFEMVK